jgi:predicted transcriptional regulator
MADDKDRKPILKFPKAGTYQATAEERAGIDRGLKAAREGRFATDEQIEELFKKHRPA